METNKLEFSTSTLSALTKDNEHRFYIYCLANQDGIFYVGKGVGNRVFAHEKYAKGILKESDKLDFSSEEFDKFLEENRKIAHILNKQGEIQRFIVSHHLTHAESLACENALINLLKNIGNIDLTNKISGHGTRCFTVEKLEELYGYEPIDLSETNLPSLLDKNDLVLAVKINDAFSLDTDDSKNYGISNRDNRNLKSRTLGSWRVDKRKLNQIKYVLGINTGAENAVVSAYKVESYEQDTEHSPVRYIFHSSSEHSTVLKELGLFRKSLSEDAIKFGSGSAIAYLKWKNK